MAFASKSTHRLPTLEGRKNIIGTGIVIVFLVRPDFLALGSTISFEKSGSVAESRGEDGIFGAGFFGKIMARGRCLCRN
jgi:hypothetical protein